MFENRRYPLSLDSLKLQQLTRHPTAAFYLIQEIRM